MSRSKCFPSRTGADRPKVAVTSTEIDQAVRVVCESTADIRNAAGSAGMGHARIQSEEVRPQIAVRVAALCLRSGSPS